MPEPIAMSDELKSRCAAITLLVLDVDGVLTDGIIALDDRGVETKRFFVRDGSALAMWRRVGYRAAILSGRNSPAVDLRAAELGLGPVVQGADDKAARLSEMLEGLGVAPQQTCVMGDDLPDLPALRMVGLSACPSDAVPEVRALCHIVSNRPGGRGAVRAVIEAILRAQGRWDELVRPFLEPDGAAGGPDPPPSAARGDPAASGSG